MCPIHHSNGGEISFLLYKRKFIYNADKKTFCKMRYPGDLQLPLREFQQSKGLNDKETKENSELFGENRYFGC